MIGGLHALCRDQRGAVSIFTIGAMLLLIGIVGLVIDVGVLYLTRRHLQLATDAAALAAARQPDDAQAVAQAMMAQNGFPAASVAAVGGYYCGQTAVAVSARFSPSAMNPACPSPGAFNAARVVATVPARLFFARYLLPGGYGPGPIVTSATAATIDAAGLRAGTTVASVSSEESPLLNAALGSLLGGNVNLTAASYSGLVSTDVAARPLLDALATRLNATAGTYGQLLDLTASVDVVLQAAAQVLAEQGDVAGASAAVLGLQALQGKVPASRGIRIGDLFGLDVWKDVPIGGPAAINAGLNAMQLASAAIQLANGTNAAVVEQNVTLPGGLATAGVEISAIEKPQQPYFVFGPAGVSVHTAQVRLKLSLQALSLPGVNPLVRLPIYVEVGSGDARISRIDCGANPPTDAVVHVAASSAAANVYIGTVTSSANAMKNFSTPVTIAPATVLSVPIKLLFIDLSSVGVALKAQAPVGQGAQTTLLFRQPGAARGANEGVIGLPPDPGTSAQAESINPSGGLAGKLFSSIEVSLTPQNLVTAVLNIVTSAVSDLLANTVSPLLALLDPTLTSLLKALGIRVGFMDVWVPGVRCAVPVLVS